MAKPPRCAIAMNDPKFKFARGVLRVEHGQMVAKEVPIIRVYNAGVELRVLFKITGRVPGDSLAGRGNVEESAFRTGPILPVVGVVGNDPIFGFRGSQRFFHPLAGRDVLIGAQNTFDPTLGVA